MLGLWPAFRFNYGCHRQHVNIRFDAMVGLDNINNTEQVVDGRRTNLPNQPLLVYFSRRVAFRRDLKTSQDIFSVSTFFTLLQLSSLLHQSHPNLNGESRAQKCDLDPLFGLHQMQ